MINNKNTKPLNDNTQGFCISVRMKGLEPPRLSAPDPKSGAAANYATSAALIELGDKDKALLFFCKSKTIFYLSFKCNLLFNK